MARNDKYIDGLKPRATGGTKRTNTTEIPVRRVSSTKRQGARPSSVTRTKTSNTSRAAASREDDLANGLDERIDTIDDSIFELDDAELFTTESKGSATKAKSKKKGTKKHKVLIVILALLSLVAVGVFIWGDTIISRLTGGSSGIFDAFRAVVSDQTTPLKTGTDGRTNILVFGTSGYEMEGSEHDGAQLTDSIMVISLDQNTNDAAMLSLPRDLKVGQTCTDTGKINEVYWCNNPEGDDEDGGARALMNEVEDILGIDLQYYAHMDWGALVQMVDSIGGITVTLDEDIADDWTNTYIKAGVPAQLDGEAALGLARARHGTFYGDFSRGASQQKIIIGIKNKLVEQGLSLTEMVGLLNVLGDNLRTSFSVDEVKTAAKLVQDFPMENLRQIPLLDTPSGDYMTMTDIAGTSYVVPSAGIGSYKVLRKYIAKMFSSDAVAREDAVIMVLNGSGEPGVASAEKTRLEEANFNVGSIGDAPDGNYNGYLLYDISTEKPATKSALEERYKVQALTADTLPAGIDSEECDFVIIIGQTPEEADAN